MARVAPLLLTTTVTLLLSGASAAQVPPSLGDVARQEAARRQAVKKPGKLYTNADLGREGTATPVSTPATTAPAAPAPAASAPAAAPEAAKPADAVNDEKTWRARMAKARDDLQRSQLFLASLQSRINALTTDFTARDDPAQRALLATERQKALAELDRVRRDVDEQTKAIAAIQEEARRAGVPAGWVR